MANNIYKQGVPATVGKSTAGSLNTNSLAATAGTYQNIYGANGITATTGKAVLHGPNSDNGTAVAGIKLAGSLNANGTLTVAPGRNTPQS